ncbi:entericidin A/B family lipoprotein [Herminiimonas sp.]|nr:entericidin A/B family lipoprotein [Herminiimonas sp.]MDO8304386.1 entericidin A/B family lipoprotein [Herminiimonas sp.]
MKKIAALLIASVWLLAGCNTVQGFGKDVEHVGDKIQNKSAK